MTRLPHFVHIRPVVLFVVATVAVFACRDGNPPEPQSAAHLSPAPNPFGPSEDLYSAQPHREHPRSMALTVDGETMLVALQGSVDEPGDRVAVVDVATRTVTRHYEVGRSPTGIAVHPDGRFVVVTNRFSNFISVIDLREEEVGRIPTDHYLVEPLFSSSGRRLYVTNRWHDTVQVWDVGRRDDSWLRMQRIEVVENGIPVGTNPRSLALSADGSSLLVAARAGLTISRIDTRTLREVDTDADLATTDFGAPSGISRLDVGAPPHDLVVWNEHLYVPTLSASTFHPPFAGPDTDGDGEPGDGTPNTSFNDHQNELAVFASPSLDARVRYTSDTICCRDVFDVSLDDPGGDLLPPQSRWIVGGALPRAADAARGSVGDVLVVAYSGSNEVQRFRITEDGTLQPGAIVATGFQPIDVVIHERLAEVWVLNRLGESITVVDLETFEVLDEFVVGDTSGGEFPATDAEIGELYFHSGADFSVDGDQTCAHCHPDRGNLAKAISLPILQDERGSRMIPHVRGLFLTRPWLFEGFADEFNIFETVHEFARPENFCCTTQPYALDTAAGGESCFDTPPPSCQVRPYPRHYASRDAFFMDTAREVLGRDDSFGDAVETQINFVGLTRLLGLFLIHEPALLPNPNPPDAPDVERGRRIFESAEAGCAVCHPAPGFTVTFENNPFGTPLNFGPMVTPRTDADGVNLDLVNEPFQELFPLVYQDEQGVRMNPPTILGIWDRAGPFFHDGRARNLRELLATPGHPALRDGETGFNEIDGMPDTHGGTSHLSAGELADLISFLRSR